MDTKQLLQLWTETKRAEDQAKAHRVELESALIDLVETKDDGSKTSEIEGYKVTVTKKNYYSIDADQWDHIKDSIPAEYHPVKTKIEVDTKKYKSLPDEYFNIAAECITSKPGKPGFKVVKKEEDN